MAEAPQKRVLLGDEFVQFMGMKNSTERIASGVFTLIDNAELSIQFIEYLAKKIICLDSFEQFKDRFQQRLEAPKQPDIKSAKYNRNCYPNDRKKNLAYNVFCYQKDSKQYRQDRKIYQRENPIQQRIVQGHRPTPQWYIESSIATLQLAFPETEAAFFSTPRPFQVEEKNRQAHTYICGASGSGKSTLLETLIYHYLTENTQTGVILIDPHGDIAERVARMKPHLHQDRLVYIDPYLHRDQAPDLLTILNPLRLEKSTWDAAESSTQNIIDVLGGIMSSDFSAQMRTILENCVLVLFLKGNSNLTDLLRFMDDERNQDLLDYAQKHCVNETVRDFFQYDFSKKTYNPTKQSIKTKLQSLFNTTIFLKFMTGENTLNLSQLMTEKKVIIFNLSAGKLSEQTSDVMGKFILAKIKEVAFNRAFIPEEKRVPCHLFVDESQRFITETIRSILTETRKYRLYLTFASQAYLQDMNPGLKDIVSTNTRLKFAGKVGHTSQAALMKETDAEKNIFKRLTVGEFVFSCTNSPLPAYIVTTPGFLAKDKNDPKYFDYFMTEDEWRMTRNDQLERYYRPAHIGQRDNRQSSPKTPASSDSRAPFAKVDDDPVA
jgi:GTPase SAR1 family protein